MPRSDAFAFQKSGLNRFLFAEVGTELNGSKLTILSVLARLGQDPWAEAARWAKLPKAAIVDCLAHSIGQMPLAPQALIDARETATRLIQLLPAYATTAEPTGPQPSRFAALPRWLPVALVFLALGLGVMVNLMMASPDTILPAQAAPTIGQAQ